MRILVTGSRDWTDRYVLADAIMTAIDSKSVRDVTLVHGDCPTGADALADDLGRFIGVTPEPHPADWSLGKKAGPIRNQEMVDLGADVCLAFPLGESRGTRDCMRRAEAAGIKVINYGDES